MENHHFSWENSRFWAIFNSYVYVSHDQRPVKHHPLWTPKDASRLDSPGVVVLLGRLGAALPRAGPFRGGGRPRPRALPKAHRWGSVAEMPLEAAKCTIFADFSGRKRGISACYPLVMSK